MEPFLDVLFEGVDGQTGFLSEFEAESGISVRSLEFVEMYMDAGELFGIAMNGAEEPESELPDFGVVLRGEDIDEDNFVLSLGTASDAGSGMDFEVAGYRDYRIHVSVGDGTEGFAFSFADEDTLLLGTQDGIKAMLDVAAGAAPRISGKGVVALDSLGDRDVGIILLMPDGLPDAAKTAGDADGNPLAALGLGALTPRLTVLALSYEGPEMLVQTLEFYDGEPDAAAAREYNESTLAMVGSLFGSAEVRGLIAETKIIQEGNKVSYSLSIDEPAATAILDFLGSLVGLGLPPQE